MISLRGAAIRPEARHVMIRSEADVVVPRTTISVFFFIPRAIETPIGRTLHDRRLNQHTNIARTHTHERSHAIREFDPGGHEPPVEHRHNPVRDLVANADSTERPGDDDESAVRWVV